MFGCIRCYFTCSHCWLDSGKIYLIGPVTWNENEYENGQGLPCLGNQSCVTLGETKATCTMINGTC